MPPKEPEESQRKQKFHGTNTLPIPGNNREAEFTLPTKAKQSVKEGVAASLYVVGGAVYDDVENISGDGKSARGTGSRG